jgi:hypothetical protein
MALIHPPYNQSCEIIASSQNIYGDQVESDREEYDCHFREFSEIQSGNSREDVAGSDATLWIAPSAPVAEGTIILADERFWRVKRVVKARRFGKTIQFLKCSLDKYEGMLEEEDFS